MDTLLTSIIIAVATAILTSLFYWRQVKADLHKEYQSRFNERKWQVYTDIIDVNISQAITALAGLEVKPEERFNKHTVRSQLLLVGSDEVIAEYTSLNLYKVNAEYAAEDKKDSDEAIEKIYKQYAILIKAMRRDLGYGEDTDVAELHLGVQSAFYLARRDKNREARKKKQEDTQKDTFA